MRTQHSERDNKDRIFMTQGDALGLLLVYAYVAALLFASEVVLKERPFMSRKFLHIMVGNIILVLPLFDTMWVMAFLAAAPFIVLTFLITPHSPIKLVSEATSAGHGMGLVYYSIAWMILVLMFFPSLEIISVGIVAMSYGDAFASISGRRWGKHRYSLGKETKTIEGNIGMFLMTNLAIVLSLVYYQAIPLFFLAIPITALVAAVLEAVTPRGLDNLTVSLGSAATFFLLTGWGV